MNKNSIISALRLLVIPPLIALAACTTIGQVLGLATLRHRLPPSCLSRAEIRQLLSMTSNTMALLSS